MEITFHDTALDSLLPFSFVTDHEGRVLFFGHSLLKLFPGLELGAPYHSQFTRTRPDLGNLGSAPAALMGELLILARLKEVPSGSLEVRLRGQVSRLKQAEESYLFALSPAVSDLKQIPQWGLEFSDFPLGDPIFDFLMLIQGQRNAHAKTEAARARLAWENRVANLLHHIAVTSNELTDASQAFQLTIDAVCRELGWDVGHVYQRIADGQATLAPTGLWHGADLEKYRPFRELTARTRFREGEGMPGRVLQSRKPIWVDDVRKDPSFPRRVALEALPSCCGVGVPVLVQGEVVAVLEFFTERPPEGRNYLSAFFEILGVTVGAVVARQRALDREKEQLAILAQASKMSSLGELSAGVAHEINNPLTAISLGAQQLEKMISDPSISQEMVKSAVARLHRSVDRISKIVSGLKMFSREASGDPFLETPVHRILEETLAFCKARFENAGISLRYEPVKEDCKVECRPSQISQVLLNLLGNAHDAVESSPGPWIRIDAVDLGASVEIRVTDSGPGLAPALAEKIMRPFFTTKPVGKGTGLGLSISTNILTEHHGKLTYDASCPNTRFVVSLPKIHPTR